MNIKRRSSIRFMLATGCTACLLPLQLMAGGWKIPENSINSTALSAAYVANAHGADATYFNPAAMAFNEEGGSMEVDLTYIHLSATQYTDNSGGGFADDASDVERFLIPSFHYVSPRMGKARFGLSVITPAGLAKRWDGTGKGASQQFSLKTVEINPTAAYMFNDKFSAAIGARMVYSSGKIKNKIFPGILERDLDGESVDFGYNLALHFKPTDELALALTYRSEIWMTIDGDATLLGPGLMYSGDAYLGAPIPASLNLAAAYTFNDRTTVELVYERTYWSAYKELDIDYHDPIHPATGGFWGASVGKGWEDSDTYRIGVTHKLNGIWTLMAGYAYDKTPAQKNTVGFELPDSDAHIFSVGARYQYSDDLNIGLGLLYDKKDKLKLKPSDGNTGGFGGEYVNAEFKDASAVLLTVGMQYKF